MQIATYEQACQLKLLDKFYVTQYDGFLNRMRPYVFNIYHKHEDCDCCGDCWVNFQNDNHFEISFDSRMSITPTRVYKIACFTTAEECLAWYRKQLEVDIYKTAMETVVNEKLLDAILSEYLAVL